LPPSCLQSALGVVDYITGREWAIIGPLLVAHVPSGCMGKSGARRDWQWERSGAGVWYLSDVFGGPAYQHPLIPVWNAIYAFFCSFFVVVWFADGVSQLSLLSGAKQWEARAVPLRFSGGDRKNASGWNQAKLQGVAPRGRRLHGCPGCPMKFVIRSAQFPSTLISSSRN